MFCNWFELCSVFPVSAFSFDNCSECRYSSYFVLKSGAYFGFNYSSIFDLILILVHVLRLGSCCCIKSFSSTVSGCCFFLVLLCLQPEFFKIQTVFQIWKSDLYWTQSTSSSKHCCLLILGPWCKGTLNWNTMRTPKSVNAPDYKSCWLLFHLIQISLYRSDRIWLLCGSMCQWARCLNELLFAVYIVPNNQ